MMVVIPILTILVLNILLPTADVATDINLAVKLYGQPAPDCVHDNDEDDDDDDDGMKERVYSECNKDPVSFCSDADHEKHCKFYKPH